MAKKPTHTLDWNAPIRLKATKREVYVTWEDYKTGFRTVGPENRRGSGGVFYFPWGAPVETESPWGELENFDRLAELTENWEDVPKPAERKAARKFRQAVEEIEDSPFYGLF